MVKKCFEKVPNVSIDRLHDQTTGYKGSSNICDFIVYREPNEYYIECKTTHGVRLPFDNITDKQWNGMLEKSKIDGVFAGVIVWYVTLDRAFFATIQYLQKLKDEGKKSLKCPIVSKSTPNLYDPSELVPIYGKKKRVFTDYDMKEFLDAIQFNRWSTEKINDNPKPSRDYFLNDRTNC